MAKQGLQIEASAKKPNTIFWLVQKITFWVLIIFLIAVLLGVTGEGIWGKKVLSNNNLQVTYHHFARRQAANIIEVQVLNGSPKTQLKFLPAKTGNIIFKEIIPTPTLMQSDNGKLIFNFSLGGKNTLIFITEPQVVGALDSEISVNDEPPLHLHQWIYP